MRSASAALGRFRPTTVKIMVDGIIENQTAGMLEPFCDGCGGDTDNHGLMYVDREILLPALTKLDALGFQVHMHAIGDRAVRNALDAVEAAPGRERAVRQPAPHRARAGGAAVRSRRGSPSSTSSRTARPTGRSASRRWRSTPSPGSARTAPTCSTRSAAFARSRRPARARQRLACHDGGSAATAWRLRSGAPIRPIATARRSCPRSGSRSTRRSRVHGRHRVRQPRRGRRPAERRRARRLRRSRPGPLRTGREDRRRERRVHRRVRRGRVRRRLTGGTHPASSATRNCPPPERTSAVTVRSGVKRVKRSTSQSGDVVGVRRARAARHDLASALTAQPIGDRRQRCGIGHEQFGRPRDHHRHRPLPAVAAAMGKSVDTVRARACLWTVWPGP